MQVKQFIINGKQVARCCCNVELSQCPIVKWVLVDGHHYETENKTNTVLHNCELENVKFTIVAEKAEELKNNINLFRAGCKERI